MENQKERLEAYRKALDEAFKAASDLDIEVYGTTFEVRAYGQEPQMEVALQEGKVKVLDHGGIIGQFAEIDGTLEKCIAWNEKVSSSSNSATAAPVIGNSHQNATLTDNYRKADMEVSTTWTNWTAFNHANASSSTPLTGSNGNPLTAMGPYFGKVDNGKTIFEIANTLGWDATIWNLSSGSHPTLISNP